MTIPRHLYKYRYLDDVQPERLREILVGHRIWFSSVSEFNDPFDCAPLADSSGKLSDWQKHFRKIGRRQLAGHPRINRRLHTKETMEINFLFKNKLFNRKEGDEFLQRIIADTVNKNGILSVSEVKNDILMWGHYANSHKGVALMFDPVAMTGRLPLPIEYQVDRPVINLMRDSDDVMVDKALLVKSSHWSYEREWRYIMLHHTGPVSFDRNALVGIILGARISDEHEQLIRQWAKEGFLSVQWYRAQLSAEKFAIDIRLADPVGC